MAAGPSLSGKPWPRFTAPVAVASAVISAKIVDVNGLNLGTRGLDKGLGTRGSDTSRGASGSGNGPEANVVIPQVLLDQQPKVASRLSPARCRARLPVTMGG
jgi:hypothetical protein